MQRSPHCGTSPVQFPLASPGFQEARRHVVGAVLHFQVLLRLQLIFEASQSQSKSMEVLHRPFLALVTGKEVGGRIKYWNTEGPKF
jgi:hypothetical protein